MEKSAVVQTDYIGPESDDAIPSSLKEAPFAVLNAESPFLSSFQIAVLHVEGYGSNRKPGAIRLVEVQNLEPAD